MNKSDLYLGLQHPLGAECFARPSAKLLICHFEANPSWGSRREGQLRFKNRWRTVEVLLNVGSMPLLQQRSLPLASGSAPTNTSPPLYVFLYL